MSSRAVSITFVGDSITHGPDYGLLTSSTGGFRKIVWDAIQADYTAQFTGVGVTDGLGEWDHAEGWNGLGIGGPSGSGGPVPQIYDKVTSNLATDAPDIVVVQAGTNDLLSPWTTVALRASMLTRMGQLLDLIHSLRPQARVLVLSLPPIPAATYPLAAGTADGVTVTDTARTTYNAGLPGVVSTRSAWAQFADTGALLSLGVMDGAHPTHDGYVLLGAGVVTALTGVSGPLTTMTATVLVDGNTLLNSACGEGTTDMRTSGGGQHLWFLREVGARINRSVPPLTSVDDSAPLAATVQRGRWVVRCTTCQTSSAVWVDRQLLFCVGCWNSATSNQWRTVTLPDASTRAQIEALLAARPTANQWWIPGETVSSLTAENVSEGW